MGVQEPHALRQHDPPLPRRIRPTTAAYVAMRCTKPHIFLVAFMNIMQVAYRCCSFKHAPTTGAAEAEEVSPVLRISFPPEKP